MSRTDWKRLVRRVTPPVLADLGRAVPHVWDGVYRRFGDVPARGPGFEGDAMLAATRDVVQRAATAVRTRTVPADESQGARSLLPLLLASRAERAEPVRVLDFGGGAGIDYAFVRAGLGERCAIAYHVVDAPKLCAIGAEVWRGDAAITFASSLPPSTTPFDVVYVNSALQYVDDYRALVHQLCAYGAPSVLAVRHPAGEIATFATAQRNVPGSVIATWWLDARELVDLVTADGYALAWQSSVRWPYDTTNFPSAARLTAYRNLLFVRRDAACYRGEA